MFPLSLSDFSLWLTALAIILLATSELLNYLPEHEASFNVNKKVLR